MISQVQTRGDVGGNDEFIELHNPSSVPVIFDSTWSIGFRSAGGTCSTNVEGERLVGTGQIIPPRGYLLLVNSSYNGPSSGDLTYTLGLFDAGSLMLRHSGVVVDALCFQFDTVTSNALSTCSPAFVCEGTPVLNPHNNTTTSMSNADTSLERRPGFGLGNGADTNDNSFDFFTTTASTPRNNGVVGAP